MTHTVTIVADLTDQSYEAIAEYQRYWREIINELDYDVAITTTLQEHTPIAPSLDDEEDEEDDDLSTRHAIPATQLTRKNHENTAAKTNEEPSPQHVNCRCIAPSRHHFL